MSVIYVLYAVLVRLFLSTILRSAVRVAVLFVTIREQDIRLLKYNVCIGFFFRLDFLLKNYFDTFLSRFIFD